MIGGVCPDCQCDRGHNPFGWFWSPEMQRIHDAHEVEDLELKPVPLEEPPEKVISLKELFELRMRGR